MLRLSNILSSHVRRNITHRQLIAFSTKSIKDRIYDICHGSKGPSYRILTRGVVRDIVEDPDMIAIAKSKYIDERLWGHFGFNFRRKLAKNPEEVFLPKEVPKFLDMVDDLLDSGGKESKQFRDLMTEVMFRTAEVDLKHDIASTRTLTSCSDLRIPHEWYAPARLMRRKIIYHGGPTNSGKTYHALKRLRDADPEKGGGVYCGPLRLLALEVYEQLNRQGVHCNLITGQEQRILPFKTHTSCTVEVANLNQDYDVAVIDEIQMIADSSRGYAWTRALLGLRAREIHVCGGAEAGDIVRQLAADAGDDFEMKTYSRLSELRIQENSLRGDYSQVRPGDCIVAFSKADIFSIKREVERLTNHKCCVVYGQLPPETRSKQARLFNEEGTGYDVLVASDAIGMGLNLNIRRIVFHTTVKPGYGQKKKPGYMDATYIKQIAGRAGRRSSQYQYGEVTAWQEQDLAYIRAIMGEEIPQIKAAGIFPSVEQVDLFSRHLIAYTSENALKESSAASDEPQNNDSDSEVEMGEDDSVSSLLESDESVPEKSKTDDAVVTIETARLSSLLEKFVASAQTTGHYFLCDHDSLIVVSNWLNSIPLTLSDRFVFGTAPVDLRDGISINMLYYYAAMYATKRPVPLKIRFAKGKPRDVVELTDLCSKHNVVDLYLWLSNRFPKYFVERERCLEQKEYALALIQSTLENTMLKHQYSHSESFRKLRRAMTVTLDGLPASLPPNIRSVMFEKLRDIPQAEWNCFPNELCSGEQATLSKEPRERAPTKPINKTEHQFRVPHRRKEKGRSFHEKQLLQSKRVVRSADGRKLQVYKASPSV
mmetsp:Transcript_3011/g.4587  ORF Transcript_3011/g.4587 Transcript_3011/m.4587 type:complete len:823 (+) Transcript_3011:129-2597(+)